jgi:hypothetical protein
MSSAVGLANRALQKVGGRAIASFSDSTKEGRETSLSYNDVLRAELQTNLWKFAIKRVTLAAMVAVPEFYMDTQYQLPADFVRLAPLDPNGFYFYDEDILQEGRRILTNGTGAFYLRYVCDSVAPEQYDPLFAEAFVARLAVELATPFSIPTGDKGRLEESYVFHVRSARRMNSIEKQNGQREPLWTSVR